MKHETLSPTIEMLLKARSIIEAGWCKGSSHDARVCAVEALPEGHSVAVCLLEQALPAPWPSIIAYNDAKGTTKADILALYDRAIALALRDEGVVGREGE